MPDPMSKGQELVVVPTGIPSFDALGKKRNLTRRVGLKACRLIKLQEGGATVPPAWVIPPAQYERFVDDQLPRKHDIRALIKLAGTKLGDEHCARAFEILQSVPFDASFVEDLERGWQIWQQFEHGVVIRPSLVGPKRASASIYHLRSERNVTSFDDLKHAIRTIWADSVLARSVEAYQQAEQKDPKVALIVQQQVPTAMAALLTRPQKGGKGDEGWQLGVTVDPFKDGDWRPRGQVTFPLESEADDSAPPQLTEVRAHLSAAQIEKLVAWAEIGEREAGVGAVLEFALAVPGAPADEGPTVLALHSGSRWRSLRGGNDETLWLELTVDGHAPRAPMRFTQSVLDRMTDGSIRTAMKSVNCALDRDDVLVGRWNGRSFINLSSVIHATKDLPFFSAQDLMVAFGGADVNAARLALRSGGSWSLLRAPQTVASIARRQIGLETELADARRALLDETEGLLDVDLGLFPNDAIGGTLRTAQRLLERGAELWAQCSTSQLICRAAIHALLARGDRRVSTSTLYELGNGRVEPWAGRMVGGLEQVVGSFRRDDAALHALANGVTNIDGLPDGIGRGALGHFLGLYGDFTNGAFELSLPRWREDQRPLFELVERLTRIAAEVPVNEPIAPSSELHAQARVLSDRALASLEPQLAGWERQLLRVLLDRHAAILRLRSQIDPCLYRSLFAVRRVVLDIGRRLERLDSSITRDAVFHCSAGRLVQAMKSGRPELARVIRMRQRERQCRRIEAVPAPFFLGAPSRRGTPMSNQALLQGFGASAGVVEGRARVVRGGQLPEFARGDILVVPSLDPTLLALCVHAGAVVTETSGALSLGTEGLREFAIPSIISVPHATVLIRDGERLQVDGAAGTVERLMARN